MYELIAWQHWARSVSKAFNAQHATANTGLLHELLSALSSDLPSASIYVGHDGNLDGLATLLDLHWAAPPYVGGAALLPTPPGSALRFRTDGEAAGGDARVEVSFLYPVFTSSNSAISDSISADGARNRSGLLETTPILSTTLEGLRTRAHLGLQRYPGASACFDLAAAHWPPSWAGCSALQAEPEAGYILPGVFAEMLLFATLFLLLVGVCLGVWRRCGASEPTQTTAAGARQHVHLAMIS